MESAVAKLRSRAPSIAVVAAFLASGCFDFAMPKKVDTGTFECDGGRLDPATGLCWQFPPTGEQLDWQGAMDHCATMEPAGHEDWRLPSLDEVTGLLEDCDLYLESTEAGWCTSCSGSEVCNALFPDGEQWGLVWTSSSCAFYETCAWSLDFGSGSVSAVDGPSSWISALCVYEAAGGDAGE